MPVITTPATARLLGQTVNVSFSATTGWGVRPASLTLVAPANAFNAVVGQVTDLQLSCNGVDLVWRDVRVAHVEASEPANAGLWRVTLEDRRWKWQFSPIDGSYNKGRADALLTRERTPRQLASLLFEAMGETSFSVSGLPTGPRPHKEWRAHSARDELERLCNDYGCVVAFDGPGDSASIFKVGDGAEIIEPAAYGGRVTRSDGQAIPAWPGSIRVEGAPVLFQTAVPCLEAVGEDTDGKIRPIDELSYAPAIGWGQKFKDGFIWLPGTYTQNGETLYVRDLAEKCIFKWYRITAGQDQRVIAFPWSPDALLGTPFAPSSRDDLGPFLQTRVEKDSATGNRLPMVVFGKFFHVEREDFLTIAESDRWPYGARINNETKVLELDRAAFQLVPDGTLFTPAPARLFVLVGFHVSSEGVPVRYSNARFNSGPAFGAGARSEFHEEIQWEIIERTVGEAVDIDNQATVDQEAAFYLDSIEAEYTIRPTAQIEVPLLHHFVPDGVLRQVSWKASADGDPPTTSLSYNSENSSVQPDYRDTPAQRAKRVADQAAREREAVRLGKVVLP